MHTSSIQENLLRCAYHIKCTCTVALVYSFSNGKTMVTRHLFAVFYQILLFFNKAENYDMIIGILWDKVFACRFQFLPYSGLFKSLKQMWRHCRYWIDCLLSIIPLLSKFHQWKFMHCLFDCNKYFCFWNVNLQNCSLNTSYENLFVWFCFQQLMICTSQNLKCVLI